MAKLRERNWSAARIAEHFTKAGTPITVGSINWACLLIGADVPPKFWRATPQLTEPYRRGRHVVYPYSAADDALILKMDREGCGHASIGRALNPPRKANSIKGRLLTLARREARAEGGNR